MKTQPPSTPEKTEIDRLLGESAPIWAGLYAQLSSQFAPVSEKWNFTRKTARWSLQIKRRDRTVVYLIPLAGCFQAAFALGEKACAAARVSMLPASVLATIESAPRYAEGRGVRLEVRTKQDAANVIAVATIKMSN